MNLKQLVDHLGDNLIKVNIKKSDAVYRGVQCDSRQIEPGDIFVAVRGLKLNGENFVPQAINNGASLVVSESDLPGDSIQVRDSYRALSSIAEFYYAFPAASLNVTGITGTNGKSSTAVILDHILRHAKRSTGLIGTIYNRIDQKVEKSNLTTPGAIQLQQLYKEMIDHAVESAVIEVSSHALMQHRLGSVPVNFAVFTNLSQDHLDYHGDMDSYFAAKRRLFDEFLHADGAAIINTDDPYGSRLFNSLSGSRKISVGNNGDVTVENIISKDLSTSFELKGKVNLQISVPLIGQFNVINTALAVVAAYEHGVEGKVIEQALVDFPGIPGRMELFASSGKRIFVDYAHTPDALEKVLTALRPHTSRLLCLFGCGGDRDIGKRALMASSAEEIADEIIVTDDNPRTEDPQKIINDIMSGFDSTDAVHCERDRYKAIEFGIKTLKSDDILLVAGKGHEDYQIYGTEKQSFCDRTVVKEILEKLSA